MDGHLTMKEADRLQLMVQIAERRLTQRRAGELLGIGERQVRRLYSAYRKHGAEGLISGHRGKPSQRQLSAETKKRALELVRERYGDFGPTLAHEKLTEIHGPMAFFRVCATILTASNVASTGKGARHGHITRRRSKELYFDSTFYVAGRGG